MPRIGIFLPALFLLLPACGRTERPEKPLFEAWKAAYLKGAKIGHEHTLTVAEQRGGQTVYRTTRMMELTVKRYGAVQRISIEQGCEETPEGKVLSLSLVNRMGDGTRMASSATVEGDKLRIKTKGAERTVPWDDANLGLYAQEQVFARREAKAGDRFSFKSFEMVNQRPLGLNAQVKGIEATDQLTLEKGADGKDKVGRAPVDLLRAVVTSDPLRSGTTEVQFPPKTLWLDREGQTAREQFEFPGLGMLVQYVATEELALKEKADPALLPDLGLEVMIPLPHPLARPDHARRVTYRVTLAGGIKPPFVQDERQSIAPLKKDVFDLKVQAVLEPGTNRNAASPGQEYTQSNAFIDSADPAIQAIAAKAVSKGMTPYAKAVALEKWVHGRMEFSAKEGFPPASQVARDLKGDCRQHALLLAALLRAAGLPSRTALGLVYYRRPGEKAMLAFHMWTEAYIGGKWLALDAVSGRRGVGPTHLAMTHHSWAGTETMEPLLPIAQALGKLKVEIVAER